MEFLCDEMLVRLGKWLRAAGHDTLIAEKGQNDQFLLQLAICQKRTLITRDRHFLVMLHPPQSVIFLVSNSVPECMKELSLQLNINWLYRPFSRCLVCNTPFIKADVVQAVSDISAEKCLYCPHCHKTYWEGSHTARMLKKLSEFHKQ